MGSATMDRLLRAEKAKGGNRRHAPRTKPGSLLRLIPIVSSRELSAAAPGYVEVVHGGRTHLEEWGCGRVIPLRSRARRRSGAELPTAARVPAARRAIIQLETFLVGKHKIMA